MKKWKIGSTNSRALGCCGNMHPSIKIVTKSGFSTMEKKWKNTVLYLPLVTAWKYTGILISRKWDKDWFFEDISNKNVKTKPPQYWSTQKKNIKRLTRASDLIVGLTTKFGSGCSITGLETIGTPGWRWVGGLGASCYGVNLRKLQFTT